MNLSDGAEIFHLSVWMPEGTTQAQDDDISRQVQQIVRETREQGQKEGWNAELVRNLIMERLKSMLPEGYEAQFLDANASAEKFRKMMEEMVKTANGQTTGGGDGSESAMDGAAVASIVAKMIGNVSNEHGTRPRDWATPLDVAVFGIRAGKTTINHAMLESAREALADACDGIDVFESYLKDSTTPQPDMMVALINAKIALASALSQQVQATVLWTHEADLAAQRRAELFEDDGTDPMTTPFGVSRAETQDSPEDAKDAEDGPEDSPEGQDSPLPEGLTEGDFREV